MFHQLRQITGHKRVATRSTSKRDLRIEHALAQKLLTTLHSRENRKFDFDAERTKSSWSNLASFNENHEHADCANTVFNNSWRNTRVGKRDPALFCCRDRIKSKRCVYVNDVDKETKSAVHVKAK